MKALEQKKLTLGLNRLKSLLAKSEQEKENLRKNIVDANLAERTITELRTKLSESISRVDSDALVKAARDEADKLAKLYEVEQNKSKAAQDSCATLKLRIDEDEVAKQLLKDKAAEQATEITSLKTQLAEVNVARRTAEYEVQSAHTAFAAELFSDLPQSAEKAAQYYDQFGPEEPLREFWAAYRNRTQPLLLADKVKQMAELKYMAEAAMEAAFKTLWPHDPLPQNLFDLSLRLEDAAPRIAEWKSSAAREAARQAWACLKSHYPSLQLEPIVLVNPVDSSGNPVLLEAYFDEVMPYARHTEQSCHLSSIIE